VSFSLKTRLSYSSTLRIDPEVFFFKLGFISNYLHSYKQALNTSFDDVVLYFLSYLFVGSFGHFCFNGGLSACFVGILGLSALITLLEYHQG